MCYFEDQQDVRDWLEPLGYEEFWREVSTFDLRLQSKESCDQQISSGSVDEATVLRVLKGMVRMQVIDQQNLPPRDYVAPLSMH
ncbi:hypothetical protein GGD81_004194 [Rhodobium orientis]|uniref:Uncharacterized protein n=1 Tax=Rhodobium orientis TaxID=34017 RepID=A0A327JUY8_9HYPH|nr:hypothetical protein [Rhodobium orientis]MBB4305126.1 hypothetical protein [Rhodobium orientis]MBK5950901.1 hypothetical protein [Rhodobium orientis]RAI27018.1 hypothetical protein CH339_11790 [Rhodobium orientis]